MHVSRILPALAGVVVSLLLLSASALAVPITVNLRVEGSSSTLFEGPVSTEAVGLPGFTTASSPEPHPCDVSHNGGNEGFAASTANATTALRDAALASGLAFDAKWFSSLNDFEVNKVGPDTNGGEAEGFPSWGYAVNFTTANVGGCQFQLAPGSEVLWAYNYFNLKHLLNLKGPATITTGTPFTVHVTDGQTGEVISGASIGQLVDGVTGVGASSSTTDPAGNATVTLTQAGTVTLKATQSESVRSNGLIMCVHNSNDGACGTTVSGGGGSGKSPTTPQTPKTTASDVAKVAGVKDHHVYSRRSAPRVLKGSVEVPAGDTLRQVRIRLERRHRGRCFTFSGSRARFVRAKKCGSASFFSVGGSESFSYLLPARLPKGQYVFDIEGVDSKGQTTKLVSGVSHVVFQVK
jgi:hypothetical protein